jgi:hypothetical protein
MTNPEMEGVDVSKVSLAFHAMGDVFKAEDMFHGVRNAGFGAGALGNGAASRSVGKWDIQEGRHFLQEWGDEVAKLAIQVCEAKGEVNMEGVKRV